LCRTFTPPPQHHARKKNDQGANLATLLCALQGADLLEPRQRFRAAACICGSAFGWHKHWATGADVLPDRWPRATAAGDAPLFASKLSTPSLHLIGTSDPLKASSEALAALFDGPTVAYFKSGHKPPTQTETAAAVAGFLGKCALSS